MFQVRLITSSLERTVLGAASLEWVNVKKKPQNKVASAETGETENDLGVTSDTGSVKGWEWKKQET